MNHESAKSTKEMREKERFLLLFSLFVLFAPSWFNNP